VLILEIIGGLLILVFLVVIHELGHALVAARNGVVVEEFGIGFPPRAWAKKLKNGVLFTLNWLPIGGFVKLQGEHDAADKKGDYGAATFWQKTKILLAGVLINWVMAVILLTILAWTGLPKILPNQFSVAGDTQDIKQPVLITRVLDGDPAAKAGFKRGDEVTAINGQKVTDANQFIDLTRAQHGKTVDITYTRQGKSADASVALLNTSSGTVFGAELGQKEMLRATWSAPIVGVVTTAQLTWATLQGLGGLVANLAMGIVLHFSTSPSAQQQASSALNSVSQSVAGPIGILGKIFPAAEQSGPTQLVFLTAIISLTLAVTNVLPIPALDGGRWFVMAAFRLIRKPLTKAREERIQMVGFSIMVIVFILITVGDVVKFF
jgi:regulator of sigma E protease